MGASLGGIIGTKPQDKIFSGETLSKRRIWCSGFALLEWTMTSCHLSDSTVDSTLVLAIAYLINALALIRYPIEYIGLVALMVYLSQNM